MRREEYKGFTIIVRVFQQPESLRWRSRLNLAFTPASGEDLSPTVDLPNDYGTSDEATDAGIELGRQSVDQHPQLSLVAKGLENAEPVIHRQIKDGLAKLAVPFLCLVPLLTVGALAKSKWLLRLFVYPLQLVRLIAAGWVGVRAYRFLDRIMPDRFARLENDSPDYAHFPPGKPVRLDLAASAFLIGLAALMLLILPSTHRLAAAFQHEFPSNDQD